MPSKEACRRGGKTRAAMPDFIEHQRRAGKRSAEVNDMSALGKLGAAATIRKFGRDFLIERCRVWRLEHPSSHEKDVINILNKAGILFEREKMIEGMPVDFLLRDTNIVIEVNGAVHYEPLFADDARKERDANKIERLQQAGYRVIVLDYRELAEQKIIELLKS